MVLGDRNRRLAAVAQLVERVLGKDEVTGSSPVSSSSQGACPAIASRVGLAEGLATASLAAELVSFFGSLGSVLKNHAHR